MISQCSMQTFRDSINHSEMKTVSNVGLLLPDTPSGIASVMIRLGTE